MIHRLILILCLALTLQSAAGAENYLPADCTALVQMLPPPPAADSLAGRADLDTLLQLQADRTPAQIKRAKVVSAQNVADFARPVLGDWFNATNCPRTMAFFADISKEASRQVVDPAKDKWNRPRPFNACTNIHPVVSRPSNTSYPSGHSSAAAMWAAILGAAYPDHAADFQLRIHETMWCRELGGVHYPTDTEAGALLGAAIGKTMLESPAMAAALQTIRDESAPYLHAINADHAAPAEVPALK